MVFTNKRLLQIIIICGCFVFASCKKTDKIIFKYIDSANLQDGTINLKKALNVDYDTAFLFGDCTNNKEIEKALGTPYPQKTFLKDSEYKLILLKDNKIVYDNSFYCHRMEFFFYGSKYCYPKNEVWYYYMWTDSIFDVSLIETWDGRFYKLRPSVNPVDSM